MPILRPLIIIKLVASLLFFASFSALAEPTKEDRVKAAILFKITKFITWPSPKTSLTICIIGDGSLNSEIQKINRKFSMGRRLSITHKVPGAPLEKLCEIVFIHNTERSVIGTVLDKLREKPVLTISDSEQFTQQGGVVELFRTGNKIRFAINRNSVKDSQLTISSKLLNLAKIVE